MLIAAAILLTGILWFAWNSGLLPFGIGNSAILDKPFTESDKAIANPLTGFAPRADQSAFHDDITLVYVDVFWSDLEPTEGSYDWEAIESTYQFKRWRSEGKHAVLRFVLDYPGSQAHRDIPDWLYEKTGDGKAYSNSYGKGYSPNYTNTKLIAAYEKAVKAMGERWGSDTFVSFIEIGGLGHWGEWHTDLPDGSSGSMPQEAIRDQYVDPWLTAFPKAEFLMRRPFTIAAEEDLGLFNDVFGEEEGTEEWLGWIEKGGSFDQTGEKNALTPMPDFWKTAPSGGEIASSIDISHLLGADLSSTTSALKDSHTTFLGPKVPDQAVNPSGYDTMRQTMGYRFWISEAKQVSSRKIELTWENSGVAPFYWKWPVKVYVQTEDETQSLDTDFDIRTVLPGESKTMTVTLSKDLAKNWKTISLAIQDPMTGQDAIRFAIDGLEDQVRIPVLKNEQ